VLETAASADGHVLQAERQAGEAVVVADRDQQPVQALDQFFVLMDPAPQLVRVLHQHPNVPYEVVLQISQHGIWPATEDARRASR
jgi:hypothetical protein